MANMWHVAGDTRMPIIPVQGDPRVVIGRDEELFPLLTVTSLIHPGLNYAKQLGKNTSLSNNLGIFLEITMKKVPY